MSGGRWPHVAIPGAMVARSDASGNIDHRPTHSQPVGRATFLQRQPVRRLCGRSGCLLPPIDTGQDPKHDDHHRHQPSTAITVSRTSSKPSQATSSASDMFVGSFLFLFSLSPSLSLCLSLSRKTLGIMCRQWRHRASCRTRVN